MVHQINDIRNCPFLNINFRFSKTVFLNSFNFVFQDILPNTLIGALDPEYPVFQTFVLIVRRVLTVPKRFVWFCSSWLFYVFLLLCLSLIYCVGYQSIFLTHMCLKIGKNSCCSYARPAQPGPIR